jgi:hypothetical protein
VHVMLKTAALRPLRFVAMIVFSIIIAPARA